MQVDPSERVWGGVVSHRTGLLSYGLVGNLGSGLLADDKAAIRVIVYCVVYSQMFVFVHSRE
jgi:hypothetical protein